MYSNDYDDGRLMNAYIVWSKRLARLHQHTVRIYQETRDMHRNDEGKTISTENEEVKADEESCSKCKGLAEEDEKNVTVFPHIQDLCSADRRRIAQLVKQLIKCTKEMRDAKSELAVSESEKEAMRNQYQMSLDRRDSKRKQLEFELAQAREETNELKSGITRALEVLTRQISAQEKQFDDLTETVRDLARERTRLQDALTQKQVENDALEGKLQRTMELLKIEKQCCLKEKVDRACQSQETEISTAAQMEYNKTSFSNCSQNVRIKSKDDLEQPSKDEKLIRELFFRKPTVEESGTLDIIPVLSNTGQQSRCSTFSLV